jgi:osmotically-inducible protein OsmY
MARADEAMLSRLSTTLEEAGIFVAAEMDADTLVLTGEVDTEESRQAALDVARALAGARGLKVDDDIEVIDVSPDLPFLGRDAAEDRGGGDFAYADPDANPNARFDPVFETEPDFTGDIGTTDSEESAAEAVPYFPPTDPVVRPTSDAEELEVIGGFEATSMDDLTGEASFDDRNDDDLAQAVQRELTEDALTIDLAVRVEAVNGVVVLRGEVPTLEDAENAEAVAARVGGVKEVREELTIGGLTG